MNMNYPLIIKRICLFTGLAVLLSFAAIPLNEAMAKPTIYCKFSWVDNPVLNIEGWETAIKRKVRTNEYNRLATMGQTPALAAADGGGRCQLYHPENTLIDVTVKKSEHKLDQGGRIPHCADLNAVVECSGDEELMSEVHREPVRQRRADLDWGAAGDLPLTGDFNRDGRGDRAVFRPSNRTWYFDYDFDNLTDHRRGPWAIKGDLPIGGDFDRDGHRDDIAVFRPANRSWYYDFNHDGTTDESRGPWAVKGDLPIAGDFDRDGHFDDVAVFRPSNRTWYYDINHDGTTNMKVRPWAFIGDLPFAGDLDRDGRCDDVGVYRESNATKYVDFNHNGSTDSNGGAGASYENCFPVVISERSGDRIWLFCNGNWREVDPDSWY